MPHIITHIIHDDGKHELWNFDDGGMTISHEEGETYSWPHTSARPTITLSGSGEYVAIRSESLDDGIANLVTYLTKRATDAERATKDAESRAHNARNAERASILALIKGENEDELDGDEGCHVCGGPDH